MNKCCPVGEPSKPRASETSPSSAVNRKPNHQAAVHVPGGQALMGTDRPLFPQDGEGPLKVFELGAFLLAPCAVTNREFAAFVDATGYRTDAERAGWSFVFSADDWPAVHPDALPTTPWWRKRGHAHWRAPMGRGHPGSDADHPVVHISWNDAQAYAAWAGGRLPTELEWEHAARAGQDDVPYPWGALEPDDVQSFPCNIWQGRFPAVNTGLDGWRGTAPARSFAPNALGLYNLVGNVWEWVDHFVPPNAPPRQAARATAATMKVLKGGSFLCHRDYCHRYRIAARSKATAESSTSHQGFRIAFSVSS